MTPCKACGEPIDFVKTPEGKWMPVEGDGEESFQIFLGDPIGEQLTIVTEMGVVFKGRKASGNENGTMTVRGRLSHWGSCTHPEQFRK